MDKFTHSTADELRLTIYSLRFEITAIDQALELPYETINSSMLVIKHGDNLQTIIPTSKIHSTENAILSGQKESLTTELQTLESTYIDLYGPSGIGLAEVETTFQVSSDNI